MGVASTIGAEIRERRAATHARRCLRRQHPPSSATDVPRHRSCPLPPRSTSRHRRHSSDPHEEVVSPDHERFRSGGSGGPRRHGHTIGQGCYQCSPTSLELHRHDLRRARRAPFAATRFQRQETCHLQQGRAEVDHVAGRPTGVMGITSARRRRLRGGRPGNFARMMVGQAAQQGKAFAHQQCPTTHRASAGHLCMWDHSGRSHWRRTWLQRTARGSRVLLLYRADSRRR